jgi:hypothetical protein
MGETLPIVFNYSQSSGACYDTMYPRRAQYAVNNNMDDSKQSQEEDHAMSK